MQSLDTLLSLWKHEGIVLLPPEPISTIETVFAQFKTKPTPQFLHLYSTMGGMTEMDSGLLRIWSLAEIVAENHHHAPQEGIKFADYLLSSWMYTFQPTRNKEAEIYIEVSPKPLLLFQNLDEFLSAYSKDSDSII